MKRTISFLMCIALIFSLTACKSNKQTETVDFNKVSSSASTDKDTNIESDSNKPDNTDSSSDTEQDEFTQLIQNNDMLSEISEKAKNMTDVKTFKFKLVAHTEDLLEEDRDDYNTEGSFSYEAKKELITLSMKYDDDDIVVYSSKDNTIIAIRDDSDDEWELTSKSDSSDEDYDDENDDLEKIVDLIIKLRTMSSSEDINSTSLVNKILEYLGVSNSADKETVYNVAKNIVETFTSKENRKALLGYSVAENTDGTTYTIKPDLYECSNQLITLLEPLFPNEDAYTAFSSIMGMQQLTLSNSNVLASAKFDKNDYLNTIKLNYESAGVYTLEATFTISDINNAKVEIDSNFQKLIDKQLKQ